MAILFFRNSSDLTQPMTRAQTYSSPPTIFLGVDTGGTFTDFVVVEGDKVRLHKCLSTPAQPEQAILQGIAALGLDEVAQAGRLVVVHGSTVATNAALEGKGVRTVFISNRGFADMLTLGRQTRDQLYQLRPALKNPPVPRDLCLQAGGRLAADGSEVEPLTEADLQALRREVEALQPEAVAINLLFSFIDDRFERAIAEAMPESVFVSRSSAVLPEYKEYERGMATWLNAWLGPLVASYLQRLQHALADVPLAVMQSSGGTIDAAGAGQRAVNLLLSGPAGGLAAARQLGQWVERPRLMTFDMGGTSSDVALIDGDIALTSEGKIGPYPVAVPMVDMHTIGAGGGSLAYVDSGGVLQVGPESAGAAPGPACYGRGGTRPTVTDANLVLGRLPASSRLGGELALDAKAAHRAVAELAAEMGMSVAAAAEGIVAIANEHMVRALRVISVQRGFDPADFSLCCFGGAGGLHVCDLAEALGCSEILVPNHGGVFSALGMLLAPRERQLSRTLNRSINTLDHAEIQRHAAELEREGRVAMCAEGVTGEAIEATLTVDVCYEGQSFPLNLPWQNDIAALAEAFHRAHQHRYGHRLDLPLQLITLRLALRAPSAVQDLPTSSGDRPGEPVEWCQVAGSTNEVPRYHRHTLVGGQRVTGPALISEAVATSWVAPGWYAEADLKGNLWMRPGDPG